MNSKQVLEELLVPPEELEAWFRKTLQPIRDGFAADWGGTFSSFGEQKRHWWSNECPVFVVEKWCKSVPTIVDGRFYDGTMRVGFALRLKTLQNVSDTILPDDIEVDWLGGYWKLPKSDAGQGTLRECVVSAARTAGTAPVHPAHLYEVYSALGSVVQHLFGSSEPTRNDLAKKYDLELAAYLTAKMGTAVYLKSCTRAEIALDDAENMLSTAPDSIPKSIVLSFVNRARGVLETKLCHKDRCERSEQFFNSALEFFPTNANALYLQGQLHIQDMRIEQGLQFLNRSLLLDPDFKAPYVWLGIAYLRLGQFRQAVDISEALLGRHPESPQCHYHVAVGCAQLAFQLAKSSASGQQQAQYQTLREKSADSFRKARESDEAIRRRHHEKDGGSALDAPWLPTDSMMLEAMESEKFANPVELPSNVGWAWSNMRM